MGVPGKDNGWQDLEDVFSLENLECDGEKCRPRDFQDSGRGKNRNTFDTVADAFELTLELINSDVPADAAILTERITVQIALTIARSKAKKARERSAFPQQNHVNFKADLQNDL